ncbi:shikimate dehydrogenase [Balneolaceae bacterium ANBcel3]|nr:shikimate dehydrogenase [Balneolaceae bacterium ANBcel3]
MISLSAFLESPQYLSTDFLAVLGHPVSHSLSPLIHQNAIDHYGIAATYYAIDCSQEEYPLLKNLLEHPGFVGANVTLPLKEAILKYIGFADISAKRIGAVNTLVRTKDDNDEFIIKGYNTDVFGFLHPLQSLVPNENQAIILGSGGASKAIRSALLSIGYRKIVVVSRTPDTAVQAMEPDEDIHVTDYNGLKDALETSDLIVNTTPVGMHPNTGHSPFPDTLLPQLKEKICYDIIYNPVKTKFLSDAEMHGASIIDGLDMFVHQAAHSFKLWFNRPMDTDHTRKLILNAMKQPK